MKRVVIKASQNSNKQILGEIYKKSRELLNLIEDMPNDLFDESDIKPLYDELLDVIQSSNFYLNASKKVKASDTPGSYNGVPLRDDDVDDEEDYYADEYIDEWDEGFDDYD